MARPKSLSSYPQTEFPMCLELSWRDEKGVLISELARNIDQAFKKLSLKIAMQLPAREVSDLNLSDAMIDQILKSVEDTIDRLRAGQNHQTVRELKAQVDALSSAADKLQSAMASFTKDGQGHSVRRKSARLANVLSMDTQRLWNLRGTLKELSSQQVKHRLVGQTREVGSDDLRKRFGRVLLDVYVSEGGVISRTKSPDGVSRNIAAISIMDVVQCLRGVRGVPHEISSVTGQIAERFVFSETHLVMA